MQIEGLPPKNMVKIISPAKVNLVLAVGEKREDGFHGVDTVMHALALHDTLSMRRFDDEGSGEGLQIVLKCETSFTIDPLNIPADQNIAYRAVQELAAELGRTEDETVEMVLNEVYEASLATRKGFVLLVRPDQGVSTAKAYAAFDEAPELPQAGYLSQLAAATDSVELALWNNLTQAACAVTPQVGQILEWGKGLPGVTDAVVCGSGSAVCLVCESYEAATAASVEAHRHEWWCRVTSFSPLGVAVVETV